MCLGKSQIKEGSTSIWMLQQKKQRIVNQNTLLEDWNMLLHLRMDLSFERQIYVSLL